MPVPDAAARKEARRARLKAIGRAIEEHRGKLSQGALADKAGVGYNTVALLERGQTMPWAANRRKIENALGWDSGRLTAMYEDGADAPPLPGSASAESGGADSPVELHVVDDTTIPASSGTAAPAFQRWVLDLALSATLMTATCVDVLVRHAEEDPEAMAAIEELNRRTQELEAAVAASLGEAYKDSSTFDQLLGVLNELSRTRQHIRDAGTTTSDN